MLKKIGWFGVIFLAVITVFAQDNSGMKKYTIKKGKHKSGLRYKPFSNKTSLKLTFMFDSTAVYQLEDRDQFDLNKLAGLAFGRSHHTNSARICWRYNIDKSCVELFGYIYDNKIRSFEHIADCQINVEQNASLVVKDKSATFNINGTSKTFKTSKWPKWGYRLFPYFGGDKVAPHDVNVWLSIKAE